MDPGVLVAIITATASIIVAIWTALVSSRQNRKSRQLQKELADTQRQSQFVLARLDFELQQTAKQEERRLAAEEKMERLREPLMQAADDVADRLGNIRQRGFLVYLQSPDTHRRETAIRSTCYRIAKYWGVVERLYGEAGRLRLRRNEDTEAVTELLNRIGRTFASDSLDRGRFMVWREEQRAVGEIMLSPDGNTPMGFASFVEQYPERLQRWFSSFEADLQSDHAESSKRLERLQEYFADLAGILRASEERPASRSAAEKGTDG